MGICRVSAPKRKHSGSNFDGWAKSYCALSYSIREKDMVVNYIKNQKEHHKRVSFKDELLELLRESGVEWLNFGIEYLLHIYR